MCLALPHSRHEKQLGRPGQRLSHSDDSMQLHSGSDRAFNLKVLASPRRLVLPSFVNVTMT